MQGWPQNIFHHTLPFENKVYPRRRMHRSEHHKPSQKREKKKKKVNQIIFFVTWCCRVQKSKNRFKSLYTNSIYLRPNQNVGSSDSGYLLHAWSMCPRGNEKKKTLFFFIQERQSVWFYLPLGDFIDMNEALTQCILKLLFATLHCVGFWARAPTAVLNFLIYILRIKKYKSVNHWIFFSLFPHQRMLKLIVASWITAT